MEDRHEAYYKFFQLFEDEKYFESHEVLEDLWIEETERSTKDHPAIVLLQFAVALLHWKRENMRGADLVFRSALNHLERTGKELEGIGVDRGKLENIIRAIILKVDRGEKYLKIEIPRL